VPEAPRVRLVGGLQGDLALLPDLGVGAVVDGRWGVQRDPGMAVLVVVVGEELLAEHAGVGQGPEGGRQRGGVLQGLERGFAIGVVVGHVRAAVAARDPEVEGQLRDGFGRHAGAAVGVQAGWCAVVIAKERDEVLGDIAVLAGRDGPPDDVAAVDVQDDVEVVVDAPVRPAELGDVPRPPARAGWPAARVWSCSGGWPGLRRSPA